MRARARPPPRTGELPALRLVCFDLDGTITRGHGWRPLAEARGRLAEYEAEQARFVQGRVGEDAHLLRLLDLVVGWPLSDLERALEGTPRLHRLGQLLARVHARGAKAALLTHNPMYICRWYAKAYGFDLWAGIEQPVVRGIVRRARPLHVDKVDGLRRLLRRTKVPALLAAHIGDGAADARVFPYVGTAIALNASSPAVRAAADVALTTQDALRLDPWLRVALHPPRRPVPGLPGSSSRLRASSFRVAAR